MSGSKEDIPGFFRDPKTGKYYREKPGDVGNSSLEKLKSSMESKGTITPPKITGVTHFMRERELGRIGNVNAETEYLKMKTHNKNLVQDVSLNQVQQYDISMVDFITGSDKSVFGRWRTKDIGSYVVGEQNYVNVQNHRTADFRICLNIIDMCRGPAGTIITLYNNPLVEVGYFEFLEKSMQIQPIVFSNENISDGFLWFSCCALRNGCTFAVGGSETILLFDAFDINEFLFVKGNVHTLSYHEPSHSLVSGLNYGTLQVFDTRTISQELNMEISTIALTDSLFVNEHCVIVADAENTLVMVDFRNMKIITIFNEHKHTVKKRHFSFANNMLCGTGTDNVIRIWSVYGGNPIHQMLPLINPENNIRGWLNGDGHKTYLNYFEAEYHKVFEI